MLGIQAEEATAADLYLKMGKKDVKLYETYEADGAWWATPTKPLAPGDYVVVPAIEGTHSVMRLRVHSDCVVELAERPPKEGKKKKKKT